MEKLKVKMIYKKMLKQYKPSKKVLKEPKNIGYWFLATSGLGMLKRSKDYFFDFQSDSKFKIYKEVLELPKTNNKEVLKSTEVTKEEIKDILEKPKANNEEFESKYFEILFCHLKIAVLTLRIDDYLVFYVHKKEDIWKVYDTIGVINVAGDPIADEFIQSIVNCYSFLNIKHGTENERFCTISPQDPVDDNFLKTFTACIYVTCCALKILECDNIVSIMNEEKGYHEIFKKSLSDNSLTLLEKFDDGIFRKYTEDKPFAGKYVGTFWW